MTARFYWAFKLLFLQLNKSVSSREAETWGASSAGKKYCAIGVRLWCLPDAIAVENYYHKTLFAKLEKYRFLFTAHNSGLNKHMQQSKDKNV